MYSKIKPIVRWATVGTLASGCLLGGRAINVTQSGQEIGTWERTDQLSISDVTLAADLGEAGQISKTLLFTPDANRLFGGDEAEISFTVDATYGRATTTAVDGFPEVVRTPRSLTLTAKSWFEWDVRLDCDAPIAVGIPADGKTYVEDTVLWQSCAIHLNQDARHAMIMLEVFGDGKVNAFTSAGTVEVQ
ncbi:MAG: hypothetical protein AAFV53_15685 [Myxococcota bacterium]